MKGNVIKRKRTSWKQLAIKNMLKSEENRALFGVSNYQEAASLQSKLYQQAMRRIKGMTRGQINVAREVYAAMFWKNDVNIFQVAKDNKSLNLNKIYSSSSNLGISLGLARMDNFFNTYKDDPQLMQIKYLYESSQISRQEFNDLIKDWKRKNQKYMFSGSR